MHAWLFVAKIFFNELVLSVVIIFHSVQVIKHYVSSCAYKHSLLFLISLIAESETV